MGYNSIQCLMFGIGYTVQNKWYKCMKGGELTEKCHAQLSKISSKLYQICYLKIEDAHIRIQPPYD